jgi:chromosomal replication initiator protein
MIEIHYTETIKKALFEILGKTFRIELQVIGSNLSQSSNTENILKKESRKVETPKQATFFIEELEPTKDDLIKTVDSKIIEHMASSPNVQVDITKTFDNFIIGPSNNMACAASLAVAREPGKNYPALYIYGNSGLGKTHLLHAIGNYVQQYWPLKKVRYVSSEVFTNDFINAIQNNSSFNFQAKYRQVDVLLIDDIQFLQGKKETQESFFATFNALHEQGKQVVITSDVSPKLLNSFDERKRSRFEWGLMTDIQAPELETRIAILRKKAENDQIRVSDEILDYMAARISSNIRELEGALIRVTAFAALNRTQIDMPLVQAVLKDVVPLGEDGNSIAPMEIVRAVGSYFKLTQEELFGKSRSQAIVTGRQIAMYLCREKTSMSLPKIGALFGGRDHTTVMYAIKKVGDLMKERRSIYNNVTDIMSGLK